MARNADEGMTPRNGIHDLTFGWSRNNVGAQRFQGERGCEPVSMRLCGHLDLQIDPWSRRHINQTGAQAPRRDSALS